MKRAPPDPQGWVGWGRSGADGHTGRGPERSRTTAEGFPEDSSDRALIGGSPRLCDAGRPGAGGVAPAPGAGAGRGASGHRG